MSDAILVVGGDGRLGAALIEEGRRRGLPMAHTTRRDPAPAPSGFHLDLAHPVSDWLPPRAFRAALLCAAVTRLETCRSDPAGTRRINVTHTVALAESLARAGIFVVFPSTNLVFNGSRPRPAPGDPPSPQTEYGRQKAAAEAALAALADAVAVVRLTKVLHPDWDLLRNWIASLRAGRIIRPFSNRVCSLIPLDLAIQGLLTVAREARAGVWQFSADDEVTYAEIARHLALRLGTDPALVEPVVADPVEDAPAHAALDASRARRELGLHFPPSLAALDHVLFPDA
ncbi:MAG: sugar nucleotide-binding protein [Verrucomicrobiae bacterium]|nr:sugar nucleotide-binding protein [Verrucomicrobiae bacterium]